MPDNTYFETRGLGKLISDLHKSFPSSLKVDYLDVCGIERSSILTKSHATKVQALGGALSLLQKNGYLLGHFYENEEIRYYWDCQLTIRGFNAIDDLLKMGSDSLSASVIISAFKHVSN